MADGTDERWTDYIGWLAFCCTSGFVRTCVQRVDCVFVLFGGRHHGMA